jgi:hypothetical protein
MNIFKRIRQFWRTLWRRDRISKVVQVDRMSALPSRLGDRLYIVGQPIAKWAILTCPCRCGERIDVNLMQKSGQWRLEMSGGSASIYPSLWVPSEKCGSHFWLRKNLIQWVD